MEDDYIDEEKDTLDDSQEYIEETTSDEDEGDTSTNEDEEDKDWKAEADKWKSTANNYKREIETKGLRKKGSGESDQYKTDYLSKRADILDEFDSELKELGEADFKKVKTLLDPALESVYSTASKESRFVARGELKRTIKDILDFSNTSKDRQAELEKARLDGVDARDKMSSAEVGGKSKTKSEGVSEEVKTLAKEKGWSMEQAKNILKNRKEREKEYAPKHRY